MNPECWHTYTTSHLFSQFSQWKFLNPDQLVFFHENFILALFFLICHTVKRQRALVVAGWMLFSVGSRFGLFWEVKGLVLEDELRFRRFDVWNFQVRSKLPIQNGKFRYTFFDILCSEVRSLVLFFGRFEVQFQRTNPGSVGLRFGFLKVRGSVISGSFQH